MQRIKFKPIYIKLTRKFSLCSAARSQKSDENGYRTVPHYTQKSSLYIKPTEESIFPKIISPELNMDRLFDTKNILRSMLNLNLTARHIHLNLEHLQNDFFKMRSLEAQIERLKREKDQISDQINNLVKSSGGIGSKKKTMQTEDAKKLLKSANEIKLKINKIMDELVPLQEIVNIACLRLPNTLHYSALYLHKYHLNRYLDSEIFIHHEPMDEQARSVLFEFNSQTLEKIKHRTYLLDGCNNWQTILKDSIIIKGKKVIAKYSTKTLDNWSFIEQTAIDSVLNNRYLCGTYAKLEQCLSDYFLDKIQQLNKKENFEYIKSASMFKSALIEGCGKSFNDFRNNFNVVRFGNSVSNIELLHLTGSSSISALVLNFVRTSIKKKYLPWTVFTNGKTYSPKKGQLNTIDFLTLTSDNSSLLYKYDKVSKSAEGLTDQFLKLILNNGKSYLLDIKDQLDKYLIKPDCDSLYHSDKSIDQIIVSYLKLFVYAYREFDIPIRFVCINAYDLNSRDSFKIKIEAYLPSEQNYVAVRSNFSYYFRILFLEFFIFYFQAIIFNLFLR